MPGSTRQITHNSKNVTRARTLRRRMTDAERKLWRYLRGNQFNYHKFRRQVPVSPYIADFLCYELKLIIEVDGGQHSKQHFYDSKRTAFLNAHGFYVLRYWNNDVLLNIEGVLTDILKRIEGHKKTPHPAHMCSRTSPKGEVIRPFPWGEGGERSEPGEG